MIRRRKLADPRCRRLWFRLTRGEKATLEANAAAAGETVSDFVRGLVLGAETRRIRRRAMPLETAQLVRALTPIGTNLNTIARALSTSGAMPKSVSLEDACRAVRDALAGLR